jgi:hypothetical protein
MEIRSIHRRMFANLESKLSSAESQIADLGPAFQRARKLIERDADWSKSQYLEFRQFINKAKTIRNENELLEYIRHFTGEYGVNIDDMRVAEAHLEGLLEDMGPGEFRIIDN